MTLSALFQLYCGGQLYSSRKLEKLATCGSKLQTLIHNLTKFVSNIPSHVQDSNSQV